MVRDSRNDRLQFGSDRISIFLRLMLFKVEGKEKEKKKKKGGEVVLLTKQRLGGRAG